jgi:hypothetical protein
MRRTHYGGIGPPGHSDELVRTLRNWLREASNPIGSLPTGTDSVEWALRRFIAWWVAPLRGTIDEIEDCLTGQGGVQGRGYGRRCRGDRLDAANSRREPADHLGLYSWNEP